MRSALVVAPADPRVGGASARHESLAWLRGQLARYGFHVVIVGGRHDPLADLRAAAEALAAGDTVLVHVSGRLSRPDGLALGGDRVLPLRVLTEVLEERTPAHASFVGELMDEGSEDDALAAAERLAEAVGAFGARERGYSVLAALRPISAPSDRFPF